MLFDHLDGIARYWARVQLDPGRDSVQDRLDGLLFSILVTLDGGSGGMPSFDLVPSTHEDDESYHRENGENWWPADTVINECQLHEVWSARNRKK